MTALIELPAVPTREQIEMLQAQLLKLPQVEPKTTHRFADGMYAREVFRTAGTLIVGKVHKKEHFFVVLAGELTLWTEAGMKRVTAPFIWVSQPGTKRVTYAHTDAIALTVHQVSSRDLESIEAELVEHEVASPFGVGNVLLPDILEALT
jgi:hypothetical protein